MNFSKKRADVQWLCALCNLCGIGGPARARGGMVQKSYASFGAPAKMFMSLRIWNKTR